MGCDDISVQVKEQAICTLWNLSVDEKFRMKIANSDILPLLVKSLDDEDIRVQEAAGGVLANLALSQFNHSIMVEAGVIPKLVRHLLVSTILISYIVVDFGLSYMRQTLYKVKQFKECSIF